MAVAVANRQRRVAIPAARLARAARAALAAVGRAGGDVEVLVVGDDEIRRLNAAWRGVRRRTDVLAFPLCIPNAPSPLVGQVVISADAARRQARSTSSATTTGTPARPGSCTCGSGRSSRQTVDGYPRDSGPGSWNEQQLAERSRVAPRLRPPTDGAGLAGPAGMKRDMRS